jgi:medium-chain acyl-[acyl-carrier-protein] hydrolase
MDREDGHELVVYFAERFFACCGGCMEQGLVWVEEKSGSVYETDFQKHLKPAAALRVMLEVGANQADSFGYTYEAMLARQMAWVLARVKIKFVEPVPMGEHVTVHTWPKGVQQKLFFMRDMQMFGADGRTLVLATTAWLLIDPHARRILPSQSLANVPSLSELSAIYEPLEKIVIPEGLPEKMNVTVGYSVVDLMGHANSTRYIEWICDCFPLEMYHEKRLQWLQINYVNETLPGERLTIAAGADLANPQCWLVKGTNQESGARAFDAAVGWATIEDQVPA